MGFRARLCQRSLAPVWNDFWLLWWPMVSGDGLGLRFPYICLTVEEKPRKKPQSGKLTWPGIKPGPTMWEATTLPLDQSGGPYRVLLKSLEGKGSFGRSRRRWEDNIKVDLKEVGLMLGSEQTLLKIGTCAGLCKGGTVSPGYLKARQLIW